jgi:hypothetical protein
MKIHRLKTWPSYFKDIISGDKNFEVRKDDRNFQKGEGLVLMEFDPMEEAYTGRSMAFEISYILPGGLFGIEEGYCVIGLKRPRIENNATYELFYKTAVKYIQDAIDAGLIDSEPPSGWEDEIKFLPICPHPDKKVGKCLQNYQTDRSEG